jgi:hypothetical protein
VKVGEAAQLRIAVNGQDVQPDFEVDPAPGQIATSFGVAVPEGASLSVDKLVAIYWKTKSLPSLLITDLECARPVLLVMMHPALCSPLLSVVLATKV